MLWRRLNREEDILKGCREGLTEKVIFKNWKRSRNESLGYLGNRLFRVGRIGSVVAVRQKCTWWGTRGVHQGAQGGWTRMREGMRVVEAKVRGMRWRQNVQDVTNHSNNFGFYSKCMGTHWKILSQGLIRFDFISDCKWNRLVVVLRLDRIMGARAEAGKPLRGLLAQALWEMMIAKNRVVAVEMVKTGQILNIFWRETCQDSFKDWLWNRREKEDKDGWCQGFDLSNKMDENTINEVS